MVRRIAVSGMIFVSRTGARASAPAGRAASAALLPQASRSSHPRRRCVRAVRSPARSPGSRRGRAPCGAPAVRSGDDRASAGSATDASASGALRSRRGPLLLDGLVILAGGVLDAFLLVGGAALRLCSSALPARRLRLRRGTSSSFSPSARIRASTPPTGTMSPSLAACAPRVPSDSASRSRFTLSVSISATARLSSRRRPAVCTT